MSGFVQKIGIKISEKTNCLLWAAGGVGAENLVGQLSHQVDVPLAQHTHLRAIHIEHHVNVVRGHLGPQDCRVDLDLKRKRVVWICLLKNLDR